jgi:Ankyrin repeats (3 copies)
VTGLGMSDLSALINAVNQGELHRVRTILDETPELVHQRDDSGATALHSATLNGHREIVQLLLDRGAEINKRDEQFGATPTGWAIEYLRERGGYLAIELDDLRYAIEHGDLRWVARFLKRFPTLRYGTDTDGKPFRQLAEESCNPEIMALFRDA